MNAPYDVSSLYGKEFGVLTATASYALNLCLEALSLDQDSEVIVPIQCCHLIPGIILRNGAKVVFAPVSRNQTIDPEAVVNLLSNQTRAVVAIHQFGMPCRVKALSRMIPDEVCLIEDSAQAFGLHSLGDTVGAFSDFVITSFGDRKPLCLGGGGGLFFSDAANLKIGSRLRGDFLKGAYSQISAPLHPAALPLIPGAIDNARDLVATRTSNALNLYSNLDGLGIGVWTPSPSDYPSWGRIPIWADSQESLKSIKGLQNRVSWLQGPHEVPLWSIGAWDRVYAGCEEPIGLPDAYLKTDKSEWINAFLTSLRSSMK
jgi:hypothetical protein